ncbi:unnamed protein product [Rodentolepis nana]|uniref:SCP domain-containing protein n=1 Tax=Rodentolepis nana TaxID=102285 RepID=A0A0R3TYN3_RODNA|nr:unnamed protein product [Rodentolepis nana]
MLAMKYDSRMEYLANTWVKKCQFVHPTIDDELYQNTSQNLAISYGNPIIDFPQYIDRWHEERKDYDYNKNSCASGKVCGHYTQVS